MAQIYRRTDLPRWSRRRRPHLRWRAEAGPHEGCWGREEGREHSEAAASWAWTRRPSRGAREQGMVARHRAAGGKQCRKVEQRCGKWRVSKKTMRSSYLHWYDRPFFLYNRMTVALIGL